MRIPCPDCGKFNKQDEVCQCQVAATQEVTMQEHDDMMAMIFAFDAIDNNIEQLKMLLASTDEQLTTYLWELQDINNHIIRVCEQLATNKEVMTK